MSKIVKFSQAEIADPEDFTAIGEHARAAIEAIDGGALGWPAHWARITVAQEASDTVSVSPGEYYKNELVYASGNPITLNLQSYKPVVASDQRWLALILRGAEETIITSRGFETGEQPLVESKPVPNSTPKTVARTMSVVIQQGAIAPGADKPAVAENDCCIAFVRLTTAGIQEIVANEAGRVKTVFEIEGRVTVLEVKVDKLFQDTATIATNVANLAARFKTVPDPRLITQFATDLSIARQQLNFPPEARNYFFDQALLPDNWDFQHADAIFRINEGIRFQYAQQRDAQMRLLNTDDPAIDIFDTTMVLPAYSEVLRIESPKGNGKKDISNTVHTVVTPVQHHVSHTRIRYGETINVCENTAGWQSLGNRKAGEVFASNGQDFVNRGQTDNPWNQTATARNGHAEYAVQRVIKDTYSSTYTSYNTEEFGVNGAIYGQTFLAAQIMVLTSIDVYFTRIGSEGDVLMCLCEVNAAGAPDYETVIARVNKPQADLSKGWTRFTIRPTLIESGKRYAWFTVTTGNHQLATNSGNTFTGGTLFQSTDGIWSQGATTEDFSFRLNAAKFERSRTVVPLESVTLENGMTEMTMVFQNWEPDGTSLAFEVKAEGTDEWIPMDAREDNPLADLPALVQLRAIFNGTEDVAPALITDNNARIVTGRMRGDMQAIGKEQDFGFATTEFSIVLNMDAYDDAHHTVSPKLIVGGAVVTPTGTIVEPDPTKPSRTKFTANFELGAAASSARLRVDATTDSVLLVPFGQDIQLNAF